MTMHATDDPPPAQDEAPAVYLRLPLLPLVAAAAVWAVIGWLVARVL